MENLRQEFLNESISGLENLQQRLLNELLTENFRREIFRFLHTLKGTSLTYNINVAGKLAHELESLLQAFNEKTISSETQFNSLLQEGVEILLQIFKSLDSGESPGLPKEFVSKLRSILPEQISGNPPENFLNNVLNTISQQLAEISMRLSEQEKKNLSSAISTGQDFYAVEAEFDFTDFDEKLLILRGLLQDQGEIIATFPKPVVSVKTKIGFQILFVSKKSKNEIARILESSAPEAELIDFASNEQGGLRGIIRQAVLAGEKAAVHLDKQIEFETAADELEISAPRLKLIFEILLHLVRNGVDHAIEKTGAIKIEVLTEKNDLVLRVSDNGRGLDPEKIRARAIEKKLAAAGNSLNREETFNLIFEHGFSTSETVSEISGRGIGLDVVRDAANKLNGKIRVESEPGKGSIFEIYFPRDEESSAKL